MGFKGKEEASEETVQTEPPTPKPTSIGNLKEVTEKVEWLVKEQQFNAQHIDISIQMYSPNMPYFKGQTIALVVNDFICFFKCLNNVEAGKSTLLQPDKQGQLWLDSKLQRGGDISSDGCWSWLRQLNDRNL